MTRIMEIVEDAAASGARLELRLNDSYQRTKRNILFAAAIAIVIGLAGGPLTKILPFSDKDIAVAGAMSLVWLTSLFFMFEFASEWQLAFVRNSGLAAKLPKSELEELFLARAKQERETTDALRRVGKMLQDAITNTEIPWFMADDDGRSGFISRFAALKSDAHSMRAMLSDPSWADMAKEDLRTHQTYIQAQAVSWADKLDTEWWFVVSTGSTIRQGLADTRQATATLATSIEERAAEDRQLVRLFDTLHKSIHRIQRRSIYIDWMVTSMLTSLATLATAYHVSQWAFSPRCSIGWFCSILRWSP